MLKKQKRRYIGIRISAASRNHIPGEILSYLVVNHQTHPCLGLPLHHHPRSHPYISILQYHTKLTMMQTPAHMASLTEDTQPLLT